MENTTQFNSVIIADNQDITAAGITSFIQKANKKSVISEAKNKKELITKLSVAGKSLVVLDYTIFNFSTVDELLIVQQRFHDSHFLLFSDELTNDFILQVAYNNEFSILLKDVSKEEVKIALDTIFKGKNFICGRVSSQLLVEKNADNEDIREKLTHTETEILKSIALGKSTKEIAAERFLSMHTVVTHRKNIFRKLDVNNVHEATKYALKAGILHEAEYYI